jgi:type IV fimbrial biogenesis protein FimT
MQDGLTLLELMLTLGVVALLASLALPHYADFMAKRAVSLEVQQLVRAITFARTQAILRGQPITLFADTDWSNGFTVTQQDKVLRQTSLTGTGRIFLKTFPAGSEHQLTFSSTGITNTQNGSFYYCADNIKVAERIVFNQAGRVYVTQDEASQACGH